MSEMAGKGEDVKCPRCGGQARVVWVSQDGKTAAIRCRGYHSHDEIGPSTKGGSYYKPKPKKKGMVFLIGNIGK
ncbi:MAG: hypothetical protein ACE5OW_04160 [Candidatus Bathyarchaeia archaeon]